MRFAEASVDREKIRDDVTRRFAEATVDRENVRVEARDERKTINTEIIRQNQNYIEHLAHHNVKTSLVSDDED